MTATPPAGRVESIIARCLLDAAFLSRIAAAPNETVAAYDLDEGARKDFASLDFSSVRSFAGFVTKVQHNDLWGSIPGTRSLLKHYGIEIETFAAYHPIHLRLRAQRVPRDEKIAAFLDFLQARLDAEPKERYPGLRDILVHERLQWEIRTAFAGFTPNGVGDGSGPCGGRFAELVPTFRGIVRIGAFDLSPVGIASQLGQGRFDPSELSAGPQYLAYWGEPDSLQLRVLEVDELTAVLLAEVDGRRSVATVTRRTTRRLGIEAGAADLRPLFEAVANHGLLELRRRDGGS